MTTMQVEHINPFISALQNTFRTMLSREARRGNVAVKESSRAAHEVSGVIGLSGKAVGTVVVSFSKQVALGAAATMLMTEAEKIDDDVLDAVGELTNMVAGAAKAELAEYELSVSLPNVITGPAHEVHFPSEVTPISIAFDTDWGPVSLEVGLSGVREPATA
jgi:chemotaxis protein CheX